MARVIEDFARCYRAVESRDGRFDGWFVTAVTSTGIYCRPSCPAVTPKRANVRFLPTAAAAHEQGFRACKRCRPDTSPDSPEWDVRADLVARAMRLIRDGVVDRDGVVGLAARLGYSSRHVHRQLVAELGAGPQALARAQRARTARTLVERTDLPMATVAFAAGFSSLRQFNDTIRRVYATTPTELRRRAAGGARTPDTVTLRLAFRRPCAIDDALAFLGARAVPGVEQADDGMFRRSMLLPHGTGVATLTAAGDHVRCSLRLDDLRDLTAAVQRCRRLLDLDADPEAVDGHLGTDPTLAPLVTATPGLRVPGTVDPAETAVRAVLGQQVTVAAARTLTGRLVAVFGKPLVTPVDGVTHTFPDSETLAEADLAGLGMPEARGRTVVELARRIAAGEVALDAGADRAHARAGLAAVPGIGPWTVGYVTMRALGDPDAWPAGDIAVRRGIERLGGHSRELDARAERWRPWRAYAVRHLWAAAAVRTPGNAKEQQR